MGRGTVKDDGGHTSTAHHAPGSRRIAPGEMGGSAGHGIMHLTSAIVKRFKSIDDSEVVRFEPDVTCLVGRNESGKTAFLEALARLNPLADDPLAFDELRDYPRRLRGSEEEIAAAGPAAAVRRWPPSSPPGCPASCTSASTTCCLGASASRACRPCRRPGWLPASGPPARCCGWPAWATWTSGPRAPGASPGPSSTSASATSATG